MDNITLNKASNITNTAADKLRRLFGKEVEVKFIIKEQYIKIPENNSMVIDTIVATVSTFFNIDEDELTGKSATQSLTDARSMCYNLILEYAKPAPSLKKIGMVFSGRDHTTIINGIKKFKNMYATEQLFKEHYDNITQIIEFKLNNN